MKVTLVKIIWVICLGGLAALSISAIAHKKDTAIQGIEVQIEQFDGGEYFLSEEDVYREIEAILGPDETVYTVRDINTQEIEDVLGHNPFIQNADVYISSDGQIGVSVVQREPLVRVMEQDGASYYLDQENRVIPVSQYFTARVMILTGFPGVQQKYEQDLADELPSDERLIHLIRALDSDPFLKSNTEQIHIERSRNVVLSPKAGNFTINFGEVENTDVKLKKIKSIYTQIIRSDGWEKYNSFDVSVDGQVVGKVKPSYHK